MAKNRDNKAKNTKSKKMSESVSSTDNSNTSSKVENQNKTHNSIKEGMGPNTKR